MRLFAVALVLLVSIGALWSHTPVSAQTVSYAPGWNLVAGPQGARLSGATGQLYTIQPGDTEYETLPATTPLTACRGYWAFFPMGGSIDFGPLGAASVNCAVSIAPAQFVMLGNPSATANVAVAGADAVYTYAPDVGYQSPTQLTPGQGAWVYAAGAVSIGTSAASTGAPPASAAPPTPQPTAASPATSATGPVGPLSLSASLSTTTCGGGTVGVSVAVTDGNGTGVAGATVTGTVQYRTMGQSFDFPPTDASGRTSTTVDTGSPRGGYTVQWSFTVSANGFTASGSASCYAP